LFARVPNKSEEFGLALLLVVASVAGITIAFVAHMRRERIAGISVASGAMSLASGLATSLALAAHIVSILINGLAAQEGVVYDTEQLGLLVLGMAILLPGLLCLIHSGAVMRGELHAQKRTLAASIIVAGFTLPLAPVDSLATLVAALALANIAILLASPTNRELNAPAASLHY
jgi:hypothetical protein